MSAGLWIGLPQRTSASGMFGVITVARGSKRSFKVKIASSLISLAPLVATITGSTTTFLKLNSLIESAIALMSAEEETIPTLTAAGKMSVATAAICAFKKSGETSIMSVTPVVFWAVKAVTALIA